MTYNEFAKNSFPDYDAKLAKLSFLSYFRTKNAKTIE
jgi:hypothetical protein